MSTIKVLDQKLPRVLTNLIMDYASKDWKAEYTNLVTNYIGRKCYGSSRITPCKSQKGLVWMKLTGYKFRLLVCRKCFNARIQLHRDDKKIVVSVDPTNYKLEKSVNHIQLYDNGEIDTAYRGRVRIRHF